MTASSPQTESRSLSVPQNLPTPRSPEVQHPIPPVWDENSTILILGSFPSVKSRESCFFYGHPQNRFWRVLSAVCCDSLPVSNDEKRMFLLRQHIALWDVIASCEITGSSDSSIHHVKANDITIILSGADIRKIYCNGQTAYRLYNRHILPETGRSAFCLPSTSPANAGWSIDRLTEAWSVIRQSEERSADQAVCVPDLNSSVRF